MNKKNDFITAVRRNPLYDDDNLRRRANADVINFVWEYSRYDYKGIAEFIIKRVKDKPKEYYCSEMANHFSLLHSDNRINLRWDGGDDDDVTPYEVQNCPYLHRILPTCGEYSYREMDYVLTTGDNAIARMIRSRSAGFRKRRDLSIATHVGIVVEVDGRWWIAEMTADGSELSGINKYGVR